MIIGSYAATEGVKGNITLQVLHRLREWLKRMDGGLRLTHSKTKSMIANIGTDIDDARCAFSKHIHHSSFYRFVGQEVQCLQGSDSRLSLGSPKANIILAHDELNVVSGQTDLCDFTLAEMWQVLPKKLVQQIGFRNKLGFAYRALAIAFLQFSKRTLGESHEEIAATKRSKPSVMDT